MRNWAPLPERIDRKSTRLNSSHTVIYTLSLHDALPILTPGRVRSLSVQRAGNRQSDHIRKSDEKLGASPGANRSEEHTSELQSHSDLHSFPTRRSSDLNSRSRPVAERAARR